MPIWAYGLAAVLGGVLFAIRGGNIVSIRENTITRWLWALGIAGIAAWFAGDARLMALAPALFLGAVFGWPGSIDMGRNEGTWLNDALKMLWRGLGFTVLTGPLLWLFGYPWWPALLGASAPVAYELGWRLAPHVKIGGTKIGEGVFGAAVALGYALALAR